MRKTIENSGALGYSAVVVLSKVRCGEAIHASSAYGSRISWNSHRGPYHKNGGELLLIDINDKNVRALNEKGATITGELEVTVPVRAITPDEMIGVYDIIFYTVKQ